MAKKKKDSYPYRARWDDGQEEEQTDEEVSGKTIEQVKNKLKHIKGLKVYEF